MNKIKLSEILIRLKIVFVFSIFFLISCVNKEIVGSNESLNIYREILVKVDSLKKNTNNRNKEVLLFSKELQNEGEINKRTLGKLIELSYDKQTKVQVKLNSVDSLQNNGNFQNLDLYVKHYTHFVKASFLLDANLYNNAINEIIIGLSYIEQNPNKYYREIASSFGRIAYISNNFTNEPGKSELYYNKAAEILINFNEFRRAAIYYYNNSNSLLFHEKYIEAKNYLKLSVKYAEKDNAYKDLLVMHYPNVIYAYTKLSQFDSTDIYIKKASEIYKSNIVDSKDGYYEFLVHTINALGSKTKFELFNVEIKELEDYFLYDRLSFFFLQLIYESEANLLNRSEDIDKYEKKSKLFLEYVNKLSQNDIYKYTQINKALDNLIYVNRQKRDFKELSSLYKQKLETNEKIKGLTEQSNEVFKTQLNYLSKKELEHAENKIEYHKERARESTIRFAIVSVFSACLIILSYFLWHLFKKIKLSEETLMTKKLELELLNERLDKTNQLVLEQNAKMKILVDELESSNESLSNFAHIAAHDLKAPLRTISSFSAILQKTYTNVVSEKDNELFDFIIENCNNLKDIIQDLLRFSSITNKLEKPEKIDLGVIVASCVRSLYATIAENNVEVIVPKNLPNVIGHQSLISQLFLNLTNNAVKFSKKVSNPRVEIVFEKFGGKYVKIGIIDNGIGIDEKYHKDIFKIFRRLHSANEYKGNGIGLATCKKIVSNYGGKIWVESETGKGAAFYFTLPMF